mmetsp:Transcript_39619/g.55023  ORF Transcript_39619/g.55023 Transcript_39619/m.55023 type:complete len:158 (-) Transcript_39619:228-701(-)
MLNNLMILAPNPVIFLKDSAVHSSLYFGGKPNNKTTRRQLRVSTGRGGIGQQTGLQTTRSESVEGGGVLAKVVSISKNGGMISLMSDKGGAPGACRLRLVCAVGHGLMVNQKIVVQEGELDTWELLEAVAPQKRKQPKTWCNICTKSCYSCPNKGKK